MTEQCEIVVDRYGFLMDTVFSSNERTAAVVVPAPAPRFTRLRLLFPAVHPWVENTRISIFTSHTIRTTLIIMKLNLGPSMALNYETISFVSNKPKEGLMHNPAEGARNSNIVKSPPSKCRRASRITCKTMQNIVCIFRASSKVPSLSCVGFPKLPKTSVDAWLDWISLPKSLAGHDLRSTMCYTSEEE